VASILTAAGALLNGCMTTPVDGTRVSSTSAAVNFAGYGDQPTAAISVRAYYPQGGYYAPIASGTTASGPLSKWGRSWYPWSTSGTVPSWGWERLGNGYFARLRSQQGNTVLSTLRSEFFSCLSAHDSSLLTFNESCVSHNSPDTFLYSTEYPRSISELLATCPTSAERSRVMSDFAVVLEPGVATSYACTVGGSEGSPTLNLVNAMRALKFIRFDEPVPVVNVTNMYDWMRAANVEIHIFHDEPGDHSHAARRTIYLKESILTGNRRTFGWPGALFTLTALIVHESRHTDDAGNLGHNCGTKDASLEYGGAWAVEYWYARWLAEHTGTQLTALEKAEIATGLVVSLEDQFCEWTD
jgi:hypothetical protein